MDNNRGLGLDPKLQNLLMELEAGLGSVLRKQGSLSREGGTAEEDNLSGKIGYS